MGKRSPDAPFDITLHNPKDRHTLVDADFPESDRSHEVLIEAREEFLSDKQVKSALCGALFSSYLT